MFLIKKKAEQRTIESSSLNNTEKVTHPPLPIFQAKKLLLFSFNLCQVPYNSNYRSSHEYLLCNLHFIKHFVHFCPSDKVSIETEKLLKGKPVWVDSFILKYSKYKCTVIKIFLDNILTSFKSHNSWL